MKEVVYSKYSNERSRRFAIRTDILEENGQFFVEKKALYPEGQEHVNNLANWFKILTEQYKEAGIRCNRCTLTEQGVELEYLTGQTLEEMLDGLLQENKTDEARERLISYLEKILAVCGREEFKMTEDFRRVFGEFAVDKKLQGADVMNIDLVSENLIVGETPTVLDYEWTFGFSVPVLFVLYRIIHYYVGTHQMRQVLNEQELYKKFQIDEELQEAFAQMESSFQAYITGEHVPMRELFSDMNPGMYWVTPDVQALQKLNGESLQIYFSVGSGYQEGTSRLFPMEDGFVSCTTELPAGCDGIRVDPGEKSCVVRVEKMAIDGREVSLENAAVLNGSVAGPWIYIAQDDPGISNIPVPAGAKELSIRLRKYDAEPEMVIRMQEMEQEKVRIQDKIRTQAQLINDMKNTKVWKLYQKYRNKVERKK